MLSTPIDAYRCYIFYLMIDDEVNDGVVSG